jgi:hypothetical protein
MTYQITNLDYGSAITTICGMVGYPKPTDPAGSNDPAVIQMGVSVNNALAELLTMYEWQDLTIKTSLNVVGDVAGQKEKGFDLPSDFYRFIDQSQWGGQNQLPALGPVSNQAWMQYIVRNYTPQLTLYWQRRQDQLWVLNPPFPSPVTFEYMYITRGQVIDQDDPAIIKNVATKNGDQFILDSYLITLLGRCKWLEWKGFDSAAATRDFLIAFNSRVGADKGAPVLSISRVYGFPYIDPMSSLPDTGYGS